MKIPFTKMHGLGNDFVMLPGPSVAGLDLDPDRNRPLLEKLAAFLCDRHFGVGADGLILPARPTDPTQADIRFVYLNSDGTWAEMCGNGIRCFALYVRDLGLVDKDEFTVETLAGPIRPRINPDRTVTVDMGVPILEAARIPFVPPSGLSSDGVVLEHQLAVLDQQVPITAISMGNPHCLIFQDALPRPLDPVVYGPALEKHAAFPAKTNVEFIQVMPAENGRDRLKVTVWERGCGFTLACGTGACASAVGAILRGKVASTDVDIELPGGTLQIQWSGQRGASVLMSGPATYVFQGEIQVPAECLQALAV